MHECRGSLASAFLEDCSDTLHQPCPRPVIVAMKTCHIPHLGQRGKADTPSYSLSRQDFNPNSGHARQSLLQFFEYAFLLEIIRKQRPCVIAGLFGYPVFEFYDEGLPHSVFGNLL